ncbi:MAG: hypothetical protein KYX67_07070 [Brevundimonas sp.]|uniref:hypothetical protein n=1 Tax=Brevundimonas sp. TaxID=1871086 RepID=UPI00256C531A|nr:hypothetical protein [Brevundimonas sp.]MDK2747062.1 hypothetical protein [Brevundimonas sp.]
MGRREIIISGLLATLALGGGAAVTALSATANAFTPYLISVGWLAFFGSLFGLFYMFRTAPRAALSAAHLALSGPPPREFLPQEITWKVLSDKIEGRTSIQIDALTRTYAGKWMRVSGRIRDVVNSHNWLSVSVKEEDSEWDTVLGRFGLDEADRMAALNKNDWITFIGKVERLAHGGTMSECEIEHIGEPPKPAPKPRPARKKQPTKT